MIRVLQVRIQEQRKLQVQENKTCLVRLIEQKARLIKTWICRI